MDTRAHLIEHDLTRSHPNYPLITSKNRRRTHIQKIAGELTSKESEVLVLVPYSTSTVLCGSTSASNTSVYAPDRFP